ncbi:hypothetical protein [Candidatus Poriferisocius sp.]|uniref:hypothetical protein n=1 Tax=Candidatus Poriferisocius sp. TaxID=3101276 RepID=UPI003B0173C4
MEPTAASTPEPTAVATPELTPVQIMVEALCPDTRENTELEYDYDSRQLSQYEAQDFFCGQRAIKRVCPETREHAGKKHTHYPDEREEDLGETINCGSPVSPVPQSPYTSRQAFGDVKGDHAVTAVLDNSRDIIDIGNYTEQCFEGRPDDRGIRNCGQFPIPRELTLDPSPLAVLQITSVHLVGWEFAELSSEFCELATLFLKRQTIDHCDIALFAYYFLALVLPRIQSECLV